MPNHAAHEPRPQQETQVRGMISDGPTKAVARDGSATDAFINDPFGLPRLERNQNHCRRRADTVLASLAGRALDELD